MKFRDGYWGIQKGITLINRVETRDITKDNHSVTLYSTSKKITHRGDTLNAPLITTEFSSPREDIIKVKVYRHKGTHNRGPSFSVHESEQNHTITEESAKSVTLSHGSIKVSINKAEKGEIIFSHNNNKLTSIVQKLSGHITDKEGKVYMSEHLSLGVGETIYGMGERFTAFVKNGQSVDIWNEDGGTSSEQAYKNIPFYLSSAGYGVFISDPGKVSIEVASEVVTSVQFSVPGEVLEYYIITGNSLKKVLVVILVSHFNSSFLP